MKISVIVIAYNCEETIRKSLDSLLAQTAWMKYEKEIIVVVNGCSDSTETIARKFPVQVLAFQKPLGHAGAINVGYAKSTGDIIFPAFGDGCYADNFIELCVSHLLDPSVGSCYGFELQWTDGSVLSKFLDEDKQLRKINYKPFSGWFFRRIDLQKLNLGTEIYDPKIVGPDLKLANQIKSLGYTLSWEPRAKYWIGKDYNSFRKVFAKGFNMGSKLFYQLWDSKGKFTRKNIYPFNRMFYFRIALVLGYLSFLVGYIVLGTGFGGFYYPLGLCGILVLPYMGFRVLALYDVRKKGQRVSSFRSYVRLFPMVQLVRYFGMAVGFIQAIFVRRRVPY